MTKALTENVPLRLFPRGIRLECCKFSISLWWRAQSLKVKCWSKSTRASDPIVWTYLGNVDLVWGTPLVPEIHSVVQWKISLNELLNKMGKTIFRCANYSWTTSGEPLDRNLFNFTAQDLAEEVLNAHSNMFHTMTFSGRTIFSFGIRIQDISVHYPKITSVKI